MLLVIKLKGMPRVGTTLKASYYLIGGRKNVDHLSFAFVAPLEA
jgi:hypothetical protein